MTSRRLPAVHELPRREVLESNVRHYRHLQNEHKRAAPESGARRRIEERLLDVRARFDRLLDEWVPDDDLRRAWREHLHYRGPEPPGPSRIRPLVFRGVSDAGAVVEIRGEQGDELDVEIDGSLVLRISAEADLATDVSPATFRLDRTEFHEHFSASEEALDALTTFAETQSAPPWEHAAELLGDGLVDTSFALTARGRRALSRRPV